MRPRGQSVCFCQPLPCFCIILPDQKTSCLYCLADLFLFSGQMQAVKGGNSSGWILPEFLASTASSRRAWRFRSFIFFFLFPRSALTWICIVTGTASQGLWHSCISQAAQTFWKLWFLQRDHLGEACAQANLRVGVNSSAPKRSNSI